MSISPVWHFWRNRQCAASSDTSDPVKRSIFSSKVCTASNTAATIAPASSPLRRKVNSPLSKTAGRIDLLEAKLAETPAPGTTGIGHTRWATHGAPNDVNAHPHLGGEQVLALAHNGVIENFRDLKQRLESEGYIFRSATDTEIIAHLIASCLEKQTFSAAESQTNGAAAAKNGKGASKSGAKVSAEPADPHEPLIRAVQEALSQLRGTYGLAIIFREHPGVIIAARLGSPLVVGVGDNEHFVASDASPLVGNTERIVYLADHQIAVVTADSLRVIHRDTGQVKHRVREIEVADGTSQLGNYPHYMLKEIFEQPESLENAMRGRLDRDEATAVFGGLNLSPQQLRQVNRLILTACGTSWHAALVGEHLIEEFARIPVEVEYASELRYRNPPIDRDTLLFAITQSGETADTLAALREVKRKGHPTLAICNVVGSTIAQEADGGIYLPRWSRNRRCVHQGLHVAMPDAGYARPLFRPHPPSQLWRR